MEMMLDSRRMTAIAPSANVSFTLIDIFTGKNFLKNFLNIGPLLYVPEHLQPLMADFILVHIDDSEPRLHVA